MKRVSYKEYKINNLWGAVCTTNEDYSGKRHYRVEIIMLTVPWREVVDEYEGDDPQECNKKFKEFVNQYKGLV